MMVTRRQALRALPVMAAGIGAASCGYALAGRGSFLPEYIRTLGIPMFGNTTAFPTIEQVLTQKVREEFQASGRYEVIPSDGGADGIVRGEITSVSTQPVGLNDAQLASRYRFTMVAKVGFEDVKQQKTLWENAALSFSEEYDLGSPTSTAQDFSAIVGGNRAAFDRIATDFAKSVVSAILEAF
ncbi:MAG: LptE family protein [Acidobacteriota bacterium]|nr:LptE family protein [Acidobacteriota bacterium]